MGEYQAKKYEYIIPGQAEEIAGIINELLQKLEKVDHNISDIEFRLEIAAREMLANAIEYGCKDSSDQVLIEFYVEADKVVLIVEDSGEGFNWQELNYELVPVLDERGRGLKMINKVSDQIEFNNKGNLIKITFLGGK